MKDYSKLINELDKITTDIRGKVESGKPRATIEVQSLYDDEFWINIRPNGMFGETRLIKTDFWGMISWVKKNRNIPMWIYWDNCIEWIHFYHIRNYRRKYLKDNQEIPEEEIINQVIENDSKYWKEEIENIWKPENEILRDYLKLIPPQSKIKV